ncbi:von Willebrand factor type A domain-containing protein [Flavobacterium sp.]|uniref:YfbK domain-containing protein n=1 Tax=Flavobacterium sp. TaxID=239 RepID=UPI00286A10D8|nr:von Willebrand factor type A domain-containing protein [Flavobacterium sp.]
MNNQDKIFEQIKEASQKAEAKDFAAMEKVWARVEDKLDKKEDKKIIAIWKKIAIAASLLLLFSLGYQFLKSDKSIHHPNVIPENNIVIQEKTEIENPKTVEITPSKIIKKDAEKILKQQIEKQEALTNNELTVEPIKEKAEKMGVRESVMTVQSEPTLKAADTSVSKVTATYDDIQKTISGIVSDEVGPLPGVNVYIKGTKKGTQTDIDGKFTIKAEKGDRLVFSFIGMNDAYATVGESNTVNAKMKENNMALNEVVVTGYGIKKEKKSLGYSTRQLSKREIKAASKNNIAANTSTDYARALTGKAPGVAIQQTSGPVGAGSNVIIRGYSSLGNNNQPLYVVDEIPMKAKKAAKLNPDDIEKISVLKGLAATTLYGSAAQNGAIIITTKKGNFTAVEETEEDYGSFIENPFESPKAAPLSTFSIDVDNASYTNIRRFINNGQTVPKDAVRVEEMVNFFKYQYPQPSDKHPFSINTEYSECPWNAKHQLLKIGLQGKNIPTDNLPASNLVFLIDVSGSMSDDNKLPLLKQSMKILVNELRKKDKVAIVVYAGSAGMVLPPTSGDEKQTIIDALDRLNAGGSTAGGEGIELAYKLAQENFIKDGNNRVILATDGDFNVGASSDGDMQTLIEAKRKSGVFLTCLGYGMGNYKDSKMEVLADKGNGNYAYIDNIQEANRFLGKEFKGSMFAIAKDVKIQIEFNPKHVQAYRLIGYENRKLRPEDFTNDAIDAGELGSGHTVTALYEIIPTGVTSEFLSNVPELKYTKVEQAGANYNDELATIKFRYKKPDGDTSIEMVKVIENKSVPLQNSSDDFKFSTAVAWFGLKLRDSKLVTEKSSEGIKKLAKSGLTNDESGYKAEFIRLVETVK